MINDNHNLRVGFSKKLFSAFVILMMLLNVYVLPFFTSVTWGESILALVIICLLSLNRGKIKNNAPGYMVLFFLYSSIISILISLFIGSNFVGALLRLLRDGLYWFIIYILGWNFFDKKIFKKCLDIFCVCLVCFLLIQTIVYYTTGYYIPGFSLNALLSDGTVRGEVLYEHILRYSRTAGVLKPSGFLCESANCAQVLFIGLIMNLFGNGRKKLSNNEICKSVVYTIGMLLTMSASGYIFCIFGWMLFFLLNNKKSIRWDRLIICCLFSLLMIEVLPNKFTHSNKILARISNITSSDTIDNSSSLRLFKGFQDWSDLPLGLKISGGGFGNWDSLNSVYMFKSSINGGNEYMSSFSYILFSSGLIGFSFFLMHFVLRFRESNNAGKCYIISLLLLTLGTSIYSTPIFVWVMLLIEYDEYAILKWDKEKGEDMLE